MSNTARDLKTPKFIKKVHLPKIPKRFLAGMLILVAMFAVIASVFYFYRQYKSRFSPTPTATPLPVRPLPSGKQTYMYSSTGVTGPVPSEVTIDNLTPPVGTNQTILVKIKHASPVTKAGVILHTDNKVTKFTLELIEGTATEGTWKGSWIMPDSYDHIYYLQFDITSSLGNYNHGLVFR
jgi:hypothetical protein